MKELLDYKIVQANMHQSIPEQIVKLSARGYELLGVLGVLQGTNSSGYNCSSFYQAMVKYKE